MCVINVVKVKIVQMEHGMDHVFLYTDLAPESFPFKQNAVAKLSIARGLGAHYVRTHLNMEPEIVGDYDAGTV